MIYRYLGKDVEVARFSNNDTAQLADGTWVASAMLQAISPIESIEEKSNQVDSLIKTATKNRALKSDSN